MVPSLSPVTRLCKFVHHPLASVSLFLKDESELEKMEGFFVPEMDDEAV